MPRDLVPVGAPGHVAPAAVADLAPPRPPTRGIAMMGLAAILLFVGGFGAWAVMVPLSEAAIAPGLIKAEGQRRAISHLEGGIVREIAVRDGDRVRRGQLLARLDDTQSGSQSDNLRAQRWALLAQDSRLRAELTGGQGLSFPQDLLDAAGNEPRAADAVAGQRLLFATRATNFAAQVQVIRAREEQARQTLTSNAAQLASLERQVALIRDELRSVEELLRLGLERRPRLLALQRTEAAIIGQRGDIEGQNRRAEAQIAEALAQLRQAEDQRQQDISAELREVRSRLADVEERLRAATDVSARRDMLAPEDGTVINMRLFNVGAVVRPGEAVMELVPANDRLVAEVNISPTDIDVVALGLSAEVRLPGFKQRLVPFLLGTVTYIADDATTDERTRATYYRAQITIPDEQMALIPPQLRLVAGMPVEVVIQVGERTFMQYITQPLRDSFARAFREQ